MRYTVEMALDGMIYMPSLMMIVSDNRLILRVLPKKSRCCSVGITDERYL
jgi:hypothetical protein